MANKCSCFVGDNIHTMHTDYKQHIHCEYLTTEPTANRELASMKYQSLVLMSPVS